MFPDGTVLNWYEPSALLVEVLMFSTQYSPAAKVPSSHGSFMFWANELALIRTENRKIRFSHIF
jgi:hypothetical protein